MTEPAFDTLRTLDAEFLYLEDEQSPLHIASICIFEAPALTAAELAQLLDAALTRVPRYRRRLQAVPLGLGRPVWVDDPSFDVRRHIHELRVAGEQPDKELCALMGSLVSAPLDRSRPLWDAWLVAGLPDGRWALIARVHHAMVDGISGIGLLSVLLDESPDAEHPAAPSCSAAPPPSAVALIRSAWSGLWLDAQGASRALLHGLRDPSLALRSVAATVAGLTRFTIRLYTHHTTSLNGPIGARRHYEYCVIELQEINAVRKAYGCTINDVVVCLLSAGYRALLGARGDDLTRALVRSLVPVSVRSQTARAALDNRISAILYELPVQIADPVERLQAVALQLSRLKHAHMVEAGVWFMHMADFLPPPLLATLSRLGARVMHKHPQRIVSTVTTNVPGPRVPLYVLGRKLLHWLPHVPITQGARLGSACLSYNGEVAFGITSDHASIPDLSVFVAAVRRDLAALVASARSREVARSHYE